MLKIRSRWDFYFGTYKDINYQVSSNSVNIKVKPLPTAIQPVDFNGAVGKMNMQTTIDKETIPANEAITLKVKINGNGNLKLIEELNLNFPPDFEVYDPKINDNITVNGSGISGKREFEYLIIPRHAGDFKIDPVHFSYFNPTSKKYVSLESNAINIHVEKGEEENPLSAYTLASKEQVKQIGRDIRYIKSGSAQLEEKNQLFFGTKLFYGLFSAPFALFLLFFLARKKHIADSSDVVGLRIKKAKKLAKQRLAIAQKKLNKNNANEFYEEIFRALYGYLSDKLNIPVSELSKESIHAALIKKSVSESVVTELLKTLDLCEMARFAPVTDIEEQEVYNNTVDIISKIQNSVK